MELYRIAEALSAVLEIKNGGTPATASFHLGVGGDLNIDVYLDSENTDHFFAFSAYPSLSDYWMEEHIWRLGDEDEPEDHRILSKQEYGSFAEMIQAVKEVTKREQDYIQKSGRRCRLSRTATVKA